VAGRMEVRFVVLKELLGCRKEKLLALNTMI
jgi:hypothetical protein